MAGIPLVPDTVEDLLQNLGCMAVVALHMLEMILDIVIGFQSLDLGCKHIVAFLEIVLDTFAALQWFAVDDWWLVEALDSSLHLKIHGY